VLRKRRKAVEYLLVEATDNRKQLVLPKGHIEPGEEPRVTAVREVKEETGHWARVRGWLGDERLSADLRLPPVRFYLMLDAGNSTDAPGTARRAAEERQSHWLDFDAATKAALPETRRILEKAEQLRASTYP
jgi:8-oxo-dGTP pyrophosphatase MutT (NUDIX family)